MRGQGGGPKTQAGKDISKLNATKHNILSNTIFDYEREQYLAHTTAIKQTYRPAGYMEEVLVNRIASILWRLGRVARYEQAVIRRNAENSLGRYGYDGLDNTLREIRHADELKDDTQAQEWAHETRQEVEQIVALSAISQELVDKIPKYESHLDRTLSRTLQQLETLQKQRRHNE